MEESGKVLNTLHLYSEEALVLLRKACEKAKSSVVSTSDEFAQPGQVVLPLATSPYTNRFSDSDSSSSDEEGGANIGESLSDSEGSSSSSPSTSDDVAEEADLVEESTDKIEPLPNDKPPAKLLQDTEKQSSTAKTPKKKKPLSAAQQTKKDRQKAQQVKQLRDNLQYQNLPLDDHRILQLPSNLLSKDDLRGEMGVLRKAQTYAKLSEEMQEKKKPVVVMLIKSGRFAGGVFVGERCVTHRSFQHYTIRKGQGKAQSSQDNSKRKAKSMGAQLRRAGEQSMKEDIHETILEWKQYFQSSCLILLSCPKTMKSTVFADAVESVVARDDPRIRKIPFDVGRPTFESVCVSHQVLCTVILRETGPVPPGSANKEKESPVSNSASDKVTIDSTSVLKKEDEPKEDPVIPLSKLHEACRDGNMQEVLEFLDSDDVLDQINQAAGPDFMTPLHFAAQSTALADPVSAAACVLALLSKGQANPEIVDARLRVPYFLASHDKIREAFRKARATLGETYCDWTAAKVGPPLTEDDIQEKKEREAEKRRRKKARQKEKKAQEKAQQEAEERQKQQEEEERKGQEVAKRIRDGLAPKTTTASNACDFCQKVCKGKKRTQMFKRLDYAYCSTKCVNDHKRELMAKAALARFG